MIFFKESPHTLWLSAAFQVRIMRQSASTSAPAPKGAAACLLKLFQAEMRRCRLEARRAKRYLIEREGDDMQMRFRAYLQFISLSRLLRGPIPPENRDASARTSPSLLYTAIVLALLLAILEIDLHRAGLESVGLARNPYPVQPVFMGP